VPVPVPVPGVSGDKFCGERKLLCTVHALSMRSLVCSICSTMVRRQLEQGQWSRVETVLRALRGAGRRAKDDRNFIEAVLWWRRTGVPWRDLPEEFGPWKTVFNRFDRWSKTGKWTRIFQALQTERDDEWHCLDSTINRAHQHAAGGKGERPRKASVDREVA
jgi:transposase